MKNLFYIIFLVLLGLKLAVAKDEQLIKALPVQKLDISINYTCENEKIQLNTVSIGFLSAFPDAQGNENFQFNNDGTIKLGLRNGEDLMLGSVFVGSLRKTVQDHQREIDGPNSAGCGYYYQTTVDVASNISMSLNAGKISQSCNQKAGIVNFQGTVEKIQKSDFILHQGDVAIFAKDAASYDFTNKTCTTLNTVGTGFLETILLPINLLIPHC